MVSDLIPESSFLIRMADGTTKQVNPFTGVEVWTVPGRADRPLGVKPETVRPLDPADHDAHCAFCARRYLETPPEKARLAYVDGSYETIRNLRAEQLFETVAEFRRVPNLFEIVSYDYWQKNYGYTLPDILEIRKKAYLSTEEGRQHVFRVVQDRMRLHGSSAEEIDAVTPAEMTQMANGFFGGGHELIIGRRHYIDGAEDDSQLASSGTLTPEEHYQYIRFTADAVRDIYVNNRYVRYVAVFQNWLNAAGASFDHLHKQLVAIDDRGQQIDQELQLVRANPNIFNDAAVNFAGYRNLVFAENEHAIAFAGFGHRFPTLSIFSKSTRSEPWNHAPEELRGMSDIIHACHAAMGPDIPCNEEWYYKPPDADAPMPWRVMIKWRLQNPAGFEGGTKVYVNSIDPESLRDKVVPKLFELKNAGLIAPMQIAMECDCVPNCLRYNPAVRAAFEREPLAPQLVGGGGTSPGQAGAAGGE